jgi:hypothetical protein
LLARAVTVLVFTTWLGVFVSFEFILAGALFLPEEKRVKLALPAAGFHAMIAVFLGLSSFFFAMLGAVVLYCGLTPGRSALSTTQKTVAAREANTSPRRLQAWLKPRSSSSWRAY